ncbi:hypothetical protein pb186bvf_007993 [Paramecium bursaria]
MDAINDKKMINQKYKHDYFKLFKRNIIFYKILQIDLGNNTQKQLFYELYIFSLDTFVQIKYDI